MTRRALLIGINTYVDATNLLACVADAKAMAEVLSRHKDGKKKNFDSIALLDQLEDGSAITRQKLRAVLYELFNFDGDVLLYFSGHGFLSKTGGVLCTSDATKDDWGILMQEVPWISRFCRQQTASYSSSTVAIAGTLRTRP